MYGITYGISGGDPFGNRGVGPGSKCFKYLGCVGKLVYGNPPSRHPSGIDLDLSKIKLKTSGNCKGPNGERPRFPAKSVNMLTTQVNDKLCNKYNWKDYVPKDWDQDECVCGECVINISMVGKEVVEDLDGDLSFDFFVVKGFFQPDYWLSNEPQVSNQKPCTVTISKEDLRKHFGPIRTNVNFNYGQGTCKW